MVGPSHQLAAIMFTDIVGYSAIMGQNEEFALNLLATNRKIHQRNITTFGGRLLKELGDGNLVHFNSALDAVNCALKIQEEAGNSLQGKLRIGIHLGEVVLQDNDAFGDGVNIASRIQEITDPGGIYISDAMQKAIRNSAPVKTVFLDEVNLKNIDYPIKLHALKAKHLPRPDLGRLKQLNGSASGKGKSRRARLRLVALVTIIAVAIAGLLWFNHQANEELRIAILPIDNLSQAADAEYITAGMHGDMIDELSKISQLIVTSRTSSSKFKEKGKSIPEIAAELNVKLILESELIEIRDSMRLKVRLIQAVPEEKQVWRMEYYRPTKEAMAIYGDMVMGITEAASIAITDQEKTRISTFKEVDPGAYQAYLTGMGHLYDFAPNSLEKALHYFDLSLAKDSVYAPAYSGIAMVWVVKSQFGYISKDEARAKSRAALNNAVRLDSSSAVVHYNLALNSAWGYWEWQKAAEEFEKTIDLAPNHAEARAYYAFFLDFMHRYDESKVQAEKALKLQPENKLIVTLYAMHLNHNRRFSEAISLLNDILAEDPDYIMALSTLWTVYHNTGQFDEAVKNAKLLYAAKSEDAVVDILINDYIDFGYQAAMEKIAEAMILKKDTTYVTPWQIATLYTRADNTDKALQWLEKAYEAEDGNMPHISTDPIFDNIRAEERFARLLDQLGLPKE